MFEYIITTSASGEFFSAVAQNFEVMSNLFSSYLSGANHLRITSIILILLAVVLLLFLIIVLYVKALVSFLKSDPGASASSHHADSSFFANFDEEENAQEMQKELELERELERELEQSRTEKARIEQQETARRQREEMEKEAENQEKEREERLAKSAPGVALDWQKGRLNDMETCSIALHSLSLQYKQSQKGLNELTGLIIDMLGRGVEDLKIAQTLMYRNQGKSSEDSILQTIDAIKDFIALCINNKFDLKEKAYGPKQIEKSISDLAKGDSSASLKMLEDLMDYNIRRSLSMKEGDARNAILRETSNYAATFGSIAGLSDVHLATGSFEFAIELSPQNINAWCRLGDMYNHAESHKRAVWAYENMLKMAQEDIHLRQVANAQKMLSHYYYEQGDNLKAAKLYNNSKQYYDLIGINRRLDRQEVEIVELIEKRKNEDIENTISNILKNKDFGRYSY